MRKKKRLTLQDLFGRKYRLQYADYLRLKTELGMECFQLRLRCFEGVNDVCLRSPPAYKHPAVSRMRHFAHGTRDQSPHRDSSTASGRWSDLLKVSLEVYLVNLRHIVAHIEQDCLLCRIVDTGPVRSIIWHFNGK